LISSFGGFLQVYFKLFHQKFVTFHTLTGVWDEADYVVPPSENGAFFIATSAVITPNQTRGRFLFL